MRAKVILDRDKTYGSDTELLRTILDQLRNQMVATPASVSAYFGDDERLRNNTECILDESVGVWDDWTNSVTTTHVRVYSHFVGDEKWDYIYSFEME